MTSKTHRLTTCHRHPSKLVTGFCASCLRERLAGIDSSSPVPAEPELRRTKSFSATATATATAAAAATATATAAAADHPSSSAAPEPRRRSCEVPAPPPHGTLWDLFNHDLEDEKKPPNRKVEVDSGRNSCFENTYNNGIEAVRFSDEDEKTMKEFIDLEFQSRKNEGRDFRDIAGSFWDIASAFSKRMRKWKRKQKLKQNRDDGGNGCSGGAGFPDLEVEKQGFRRSTERHFEVGVHGFSLGRRSCDTDPRLSVEESRFSFDAPRASWDGYLIGKAYPRVSPMVPIDDRVLIEEEEEEANLESGGEHCPGGSNETKHYYSDSHSWQRRRRKSFDRSNSRRKSVMGDVDELRVISNAKVSPATTELFYGAKVLITENDLKDAKLKSPSGVQADCVMGSSAPASKEACDSSIGVDQKGLNKFHKWGKLWNKLGLVHRRKEDKLREEDYVGGDMVNKPIVESWQKLRRVVNGQPSESVSEKLIRSYSVSCRNPCGMAGSANGFGPETKGNVLNGSQKLMVQRNRSVLYSPNNVDTGLLRFYLTPLKSYRRSRSGKSSLKDSNPTARGFL